MTLAGVTKRAMRIPATLPVPVGAAGFAHTEPVRLTTARTVLLIGGGLLACLGVVAIFGGSWLLVVLGAVCVLVGLSVALLGLGVHARLRAASERELDAQIVAAAGGCGGSCGSCDLSCGAPAGSSAGSGAPPVESAGGR